MAEKTLKDFEKEVAKQRNYFIQDHTKFGWKFIEEKEDLESIMIYYFTNHFVSSIVKFDSTYGILTVNHISNGTLDKVNQLRKTLRES